MSPEDLRQELERAPFRRLRLHLSSGQKLEIRYRGTAWVRRDTLLAVHPISRGSPVIEDRYDVVALRLIERVEQIPETSAA